MEISGDRGESNTKLNVLFTCMKLSQATVKTNLINKSM